MSDQTDPENETDVLDVLIEMGARPIELMSELYLPLHKKLHEAGFPADDVLAVIGSEIAMHSARERAEAYLFGASVEREAWESGEATLDD